MVVSAKIRNAVGMMRLPMARARSDEAVCATVMLKYCSCLLRPPKKKHMPRTSNRFDNIDPTWQVLAMTTFDHAAEDTHQTGLDNDDFLLSQRNDGDNEFHGIAKTGVQQATKSLSNVKRQFLGSEG